MNLKCTCGKPNNTHLPNCAFILGNLVGLLKHRLEDNMNVIDRMGKLLEENDAQLKANSELFKKLARGPK